MKGVAVVAASLIANGSFQNAPGDVPAPEPGTIVIRALLEQTGLGFARRGCQFYVGTSCDRRSNP
ncbi:hypothetical protein KDX38_21375 [Pseudomonas sp. CDFA 602]|uniref:hypothetical protein n=1 Tax=Pseudomonas californiensis TaxID=2829823 RepID=UPI001E452C85|nr:hypothetical protein [Pseudomonas californiensis]MCD5996197.1 hypothetical protein [Pseudomonas californiensis]MCD6001755.1 hypothetical protein [Pseudomonas californiensis]